MSDFQTREAMSKPACFIPRSDFVNSPEEMAMPPMERPFVDGLIPLSDDDAAGLEISRAKIIAKENETALVNSTDARRWATDFMQAKEVVEARGEQIDVALMLAWFSSSILAGYDHAHRRAESKLLALQRINESLVKALNRRPGFWLRLRARWRVLWGYCPGCNSDAPELDTCRVCNGFRVGRDSDEWPYTMTRARERVWMRRYLGTYRSLEDLQAERAMGSCSAKSND